MNSAEAMSTDPARYHRVLGVDFSGGKRAGTKIWIAEGACTETGVAITACRTIVQIAGCKPDRAAALTALVTYIGQQRNALIGLDFPFSLPVELLGQWDVESWEAFINAFAAAYERKESNCFRTDMHTLTPGREPRRGADRGAPFAPTNLRLYRQTFHGIRDVLKPLMATGARVLPMQSPVSGRPALIEICPAVTLKGENLYRKPYKGRSVERSEARATILAGLEMRRLIASLAPEARDAALTDTEGDALDAIVAAATACRVLRSGGLEEEATGCERIEGRLYV